jgi:hypothetical protein
VCEAFQQRARFISGYITNTLSRCGMCWDVQHPASLRLLGNALTRDLHIALYMPPLLAAPVLGLAHALLADPSTVGAQASMVTAGFAFHPLLPLVWVVHYLAAQLALQWHVMRSFKKDIFTNWCSHLFATHNYW